MTRSGPRHTTRGRDRCRVRAYPVAMRRSGVLAALLAFALAACAQPGPSAAPPSPSPSVPPAASGSASAGHGHTATPEAAVPLRSQESFLTVGVADDLPGGVYEPAAPSGGTDDYRCFLADPGLTADSFVTGVQFLPGNADIVHHSILFRVEPAQLAAAEAKDAADPRPGWECFGGPGLPVPVVEPARRARRRPLAGRLGARGARERVRARRRRPHLRAQPDRDPDALQPAGRRRRPGARRHEHPAPAVGEPGPRAAADDAAPRARGAALPRRLRGGPLRPPGSRPRRDGTLRLQRRPHRRRSAAALRRRPARTEAGHHPVLRAAPCASP